MTQQITRSGLDEAVKQSPNKWVYLFSEGNASMRDLLGGKGAGVAEMTNAGLPVPPGFTITTEACNAYYDSGKQFPQGMWEQVREGIKIVEQQTGKGFGKQENPLLVSVRSGAKFSMPGMMDTVLNLGINDETVQGLVELTGDERFAYDAYRRFIQMFSKIVLDTDPRDFERVLDQYKERAGVKTDAELPADALKQIVREFKQIAERESGQPFPTDVYQQFQEIANRLEHHYRDMQDLEFTVEKGHLYMLQTRSAKRSAAASIKVLVDMVNEGLITEQEAVKRADPNQVYQLLLPRFDENLKKQAEKEGRLLAKGLNASPGAACGKAVFDADRAEEMGKAGIAVVLVRPETSPD